jgi:hypothetical protein
VKDKVKTDSEMLVILDAWTESLYPFDKAECGFRVTDHSFGSKLRQPDACHVQKHAKLRAEAEWIDWNEDGKVSDWLREHYDRLLALRVKYKQFWKARR